MKGETREFRIVWEIDLSAESFEQAGDLALEIQRDPASIATVFKITDQATGETRELDLSKGEA